MLVRIFYKGLSRPLYFFVQSKGCEDITPYLSLHFNQRQRADGSGSHQQEEHRWVYSER